MPTRKMRVDLFDDEGNRYTVSLEGQITREKAVRLLDLVELLGAMPNQAGSPDRLADSREVPKMDRLLNTIHKAFPLIWFTSRDVQAAFEREYKEPMSLSTAATYLSRLSDRGVLNRAGGSSNLKYRLILTARPTQVSRSSP